MNCKKGDLAIIVQSEIPENIGRIVHIDGPYNPAADGAFRWLVRSAGAPFVGRDPGTDKLIQTNIGTIEDYMLRPVSGLPVTDEVTHDIKELA